MRKIPSAHDLVDDCLFKIRESAGIDLSRKDTWKIMTILFSSLFQFASDYDKITLSGIISVTKKRSLRANEDRKKFSIAAGTPINAELNKTTPNFTQLIANGKMTRRRLKASTLKTEQL